MALGYSLSASDSSTMSAEGKQSTGSGSGLRGNNVSFAVGKGASSKSDGTAGDSQTWLMLAAGAVALVFIIRRK